MRLNLAKLAVVCVVPLILFSHHAYPESGVINVTFETFGCMLLFIAAVGRIWASAFIAGRKNAELVTHGPYSILRHPLYFFTAIGFLGAGFALESLTLTGILAIVFLATHAPAIVSEERYLVVRFGAAYLEHHKNTSRLWPRWGHYSVRPEVAVNARLFTRAVLDAALIGLIYPGTHLLEWAHLHHIIPVFFRLY